MKEDRSLSNLGTVALHAAKVPTNVFSSILDCILTLDYQANISSIFFGRDKKIGNTQYTVKISVTLHPMWWQLNCHCYWCNLSAAFLKLCSVWMFGSRDDYSHDR